MRPLHPYLKPLYSHILSSRTFRLVRVLGHAAIPGNERAHVLARDLSHQTPENDSSTIRPPDFLYSSHLAELRLIRQHYSYLTRPSLADRPSCGVISKPISSRQHSSTLTSTPALVHLSACTAATVTSFFILSGSVRPFLSSQLFPPHRNLLGVPTDRSHGHCPAMAGGPSRAGSRHL